MIFSSRVMSRGKFVKYRKATANVSQNYSPVVECGHLGRTLQILLKAEFEGLSDGANDILGQPVAALQNVTCCGHKWHRLFRDTGATRLGHTRGACPSRTVPQHTWSPCHCCKVPARGCLS